MNLYVIVLLYILINSNITYGQESQILKISQADSQSGQSIKSNDAQENEPEIQNIAKSWPVNDIDKIVRNKRSCQPLWYNICRTNSDCCSNNCVRERHDWAYGVCRQNNGQSQSPQRTRAKDGLMTVSQFQECVKVFGRGAPSATIAQAFINQAYSKGSITSKLEAFMAVSQMSWESAGFTARREWACSGGSWSSWPCETYDKNGCPNNQNYFGRGFIQLTHCYNYRACSRDLYGDDRLVRDPDMVARDDNIAMATALWFWSKNVHRVAVSGQFGSTTRAINGRHECTPSGDTSKARKRWDRFNACLSAAGESGLGQKEAGCY